MNENETSVIVEDESGQPTTSWKATSETIQFVVKHLDINNIKVCIRIWGINIPEETLPVSFDGNDLVTRELWYRDYKDRYMGTNMFYVLEFEASGKQIGPIYTIVVDEPETVSLSDYLDDTKQSVRAMTNPHT